MTLPAVSSPRARLGVLLRSPAVALVVLVLSLGTLACNDGAQGPPGPPGPQGPPGPPGPPGGITDPGFAVEACLGCHGVGGVSPVADVKNVLDAHYVDPDANGPATASGYRQINIVIQSVDVTGSVVVVVFDVTDENGAAVNDVFASDGRFSLTRLDPPVGPRDPHTWRTLVFSERFSGGTFAPLGSGRYQYTSVFDPTSVPVAAGQTIRLSIQLSASDIPPGNAVCDFDANLTATNDCVSGTALTRDIVPTASCNSCHGVTPDSKLVFHGGRTDVEYCVACHNPDIGETEMTNLTHKIHYGSSLANGFRRWSHVSYTRDIADCTTCHNGGGADEQNWNTVPTREACGSCHDDVDFDTGANHGAGGVQQNNDLCANCHPPLLNNGTQLPVQEVHRGVARNAAAAAYRGPGNGYLIDSLVWNPAMDDLTIQYRVSRSGANVPLETDPAFPGGGGRGRVNLRFGWNTFEYTNEGSGSSPAPAQPLSFSGTDFSQVTNVGNNVYQLTVPIPSSGPSDTVTMTMEGYPATNLLDPMGPATDSLPTKAAFADVLIENRGTLVSRRSSIDMNRCNACHDAAGAGLSFHGSNRTNENVSCAMCHTGDTTDIQRRPADPSTTPDMKREESVDWKRMIHQIHAGETLENGYVAYGFGNRSHDYSNVGFIGNLQNCETCHVTTPSAMPDMSTYSTEVASLALASTIDTGADVTDPSDDLNISPIAAVCSSCHDSAISRGHMLLHGASFIALDDDIR